MLFNDKRELPRMRRSNYRSIRTLQGHTLILQDANLLRESYQKLSVCFPVWRIFNVRYELESFYILAAIGVAQSERSLLIPNINCMCDFQLQLSKLYSKGNCQVYVDKKFTFRRVNKLVSSFFEIILCKSISNIWIKNNLLNRNRDDSLDYIRLI